MTDNRGIESTRVRIVVAVAVLAVVTGCGSASQTSTSPSSTAPAPLAVPTNAYTEGAGWMQALLQGRVKVTVTAGDRACVDLVLADGREVRTTWPSGTTYDRARRALVGPDGRVVAAEGATVSAGGGFRTIATNECGDTRPFAVGPLQLVGA